MQHFEPKAGKIMFCQSLCPDGIHLQPQSVTVL